MNYNEILQYLQDMYDNPNWEEVNIEYYAQIINGIQEVIPNDKLLGATLGIDHGGKTNTSVLTFEHGPNDISLEASMQISHLLINTDGYSTHTFMGTQFVTQIFIDFES